MQFLLSLRVSMRTKQSLVIYGVTKFLRSARNDELQYFAEVYY
jgi:hypothetical protein